MRTCHTLFWRLWIRQFCKLISWVLASDYVLAYDACEGKSEEWKEKREEKRNVFEANLVEAGLQLEREDLEVSVIC